MAFPESRVVREQGKTAADEGKTIRDPGKLIFPSVPAVRREGKILEKPGPIPLPSGRVTAPEGKLVETAGKIMRDPWKAARPYRFRARTSSSTSTSAGGSTPVSSRTFPDSGMATFSGLTPPTRPGRLITAEGARLDGPRQSCHDCVKPVHRGRGP